MRVRVGAWMVVAVLAIPLTGCWSEQQQQLSACDAASPFNPNAQEKSANRVVACMNKSGYRLALNNSPCSSLATPRRQPYCYEPKDALARFGFNVEMLFQGTPPPPTATH